MKRLLTILLLVGMICLPAQATVSAYEKDGPYTGSGVVGQTFTITFDYFTTSEIVATTRVTATGAEAILVETTDYTITTTGSSPYTGGTLTLVSSLAATSTLTISRVTPQLQETDLVAGTLPAETLEDQYDKLVMQIQDLQEQINRAIRVPITDGAAVEAGCELDDAVQRASTYLTFNASGVPTLTTTAVGSGTTTTFTDTLLDDANSAAFQTTLGFSSAVQSVLDDATINDMVSTLGLSSLNLIDEDSFATDSATRPPSQQSVLALVTTTAATMASKTLTSPVINTGVSGTAVDTTATLGTSDTKLASQKAIKTYVDSNRTRISGEVLQIVNKSSSALGAELGTTGTTAMTMDDVLPVKTEGDEYLTLAITPASANTLLKIDVVLNIAHTNAGNGLVAALFQDTTANALACASVAPGDDANALIQIVFTYWMTSGTASSTTFKVRAGSSAAGSTTTVNGASGARLHGGACYSTLTVTEIMN